MKSGCDNPCVGAYFDKSSGLTTICIRGYEPDTSHCKPQKTTSSSYGNIVSFNYNSVIQRLDETFKKNLDNSFKIESKPYVRPEFIPYTPPVKSFLEEPRYIPPVIVTISSTTLSKLKEFRNEAQKLKDSAITPSDHIRADIAMNEAWRIDTECYREIAIKNNDHGTYGIEFRDKQLETHSSITLTKLEELRNEAQKLKDSAITPSDHIRAEIAMNEAWRTDTEWHRNIAIKTNDHGKHGIEFRDKQLETHSSTTLSKLKELRNEAQKLKDSAITPSDHMRADIAMNEAWRTDTEWHRSIAIKTNNHGTYGIEFRNNQLETHNNITFSKIKDFTQNNVYINLSGLNINDNVAKLLADSLAKGDMPNLKKLHLEGNKITSEGEDALINALKNETVQDVIITAITLYEKYQLNVSGNKEKQRSILENQLERARAHGVDVDNVAVDKTLSGWLEHKFGFGGSIGFGWAKCFIAYDDIQSFAGERLLAKASKRLSWVNDVKDGVLCYFEAENEALLTESGVRDIKYQLLEVQETPELTGNIEAWYEIPYL